MNKKINVILGISVLILSSKLAQANSPKDYILGTVGEDHTKICSQFVKVEGNVQKPQPEVECDLTDVPVFTSSLGNLEPDSEPDTTAQAVLKDLPTYVNLEEAVYSIQRKIHKECAFTIHENNDDKGTKNLHIFFMDYDVGLNADDKGERVLPDILDYLALESVDPDNEAGEALNYVFNTAKCDIAIAVQSLPDDTQEEQVPVPPVSDVRK